MLKYLILLLLSVVGLAFVIAVGWNCESVGTPHPNRLPVTRLANIPPPDTFTVSSSPRLSLSWIGDDPDGFVVAFRYRWSYRANANSPVEHRPWSTILNLSRAGDHVAGGPQGVDLFALMTDAEVSALPAIYHYFLINSSLLAGDADRIAQGESVTVAGAHVWASNPKGVRFPVHERPTGGTFLFDSQDSLNPHLFEVLSVDDVGAEGTPASVSFGTPGVTPPHAEVSDGPADTVLVLNEQTESFTGAHFTFRGFDPNSRSIEYSWVVDRDLWPAGQIPWSPFSQISSVDVTAKDFPDPYANDHTIYVRSRNEFGSIDTAGFFLRQLYDNNNTPLIDTLTGLPRKDTVWAKRAFTTLFPLFQRPGYQQRILLLNNSFDSPTPTAATPSQAMVNDYYMAMLRTIGKADQVDVVNIIESADSTWFPSPGLLGKYSTIIFACDAIRHTDETGVGSFDWQLKLTHWKTLQKYLVDYCGIGGKLIVSATNLPWFANSGTTSPFTNDICNLELRNFPTGGDLTDTTKTFIGAKGLLGYPSFIAVDTTKLEPGWHGSLHRLIPADRRDFGEIIFKYTTAYTPPPPVPGKMPEFSFQNTPIGVRYLGITFDVVYFGFPLYYMEQQGSTEALRQALSDIHELNR